MTPRLIPKPAGRRRLTVVPRTPVSAYTRPPIARLSFPLDGSERRIFTRVRHALWHGVRAAGLEAGDEILVPAYHCGAEIEALLRAGLHCCFYEVSAGLKPNPEELEALVGPRVRGFLLIHYLGFPQDAARWRAWCDARELLLIENCAQTWQAHQGPHPVGSLGHVALFAPYKALGLPHGSVLRASFPLGDQADCVAPSWHIRARASRAERTV